MTQTRVVLADDDVLLREGIASLLEQSSFDVVGQAGAAAGLIDLVRERSPDLVVVDIRMPPGHSTEGLEAARIIRTELPQIAILVLSAHAGIARKLWVTEGTVEKHVRSILMKLHIPETDDDHRRVRAVITFLEAR
jgi:DNA-binding NarL/FixJ family response regulator